MFTDDLRHAASELLQRCRDRRLMIATAESCTGGLIAGLLTEIPGSSDVVDRGFVTYSNEAKTQMLGVDPALIAEHGAVSEQVARAMAQGARDRSRARLTIAVTGVAGPGGGTAAKPVGLIWFGATGPGDTVTSDQRLFKDKDRTAIRLDTVSVAIGILMDALNG